MDVKNKKIYVAVKHNEKYYLKQVKEYFEDKNKFLQLNTNFTLGNLLYKNKNFSTISSINKDQTRSILNIKINLNDDLFNSLKFTNTIESKIDKKKRFSLKTALKSMSTKEIKIKSKNKKKININSSPKKDLNKFFNIKSSKEIIDLYSNFRNLQKNNKHKNNLISEKADDFTKKKFLMQEKYLINNEKNKRKNKLTSKYLSKKCGKSEKSLIFNGENKYLLKRQLSNYLNKKKQLSEKLGNYYWLINLKRSDNKYKKEYRINYINIGNEKHEIWQNYFDPGNDDLEIISNPNNKENEKNKKYFFMKSLCDLKVEGKNLLDKEYNSFIDVIKNKTNKDNIKIKLFKDPFEQKVKNIKNLILKENYINMPKVSNSVRQLRKCASLNYKN